MNADDLAREHIAALNTLDFNKVIAALPDVVDEALKKTCPERYTPELAARIVEATGAHLVRSCPALCPVWPGLCTEKKPGHLDHVNDQNYITDKRGERLIDVYFLQFTNKTGAGPAKICISGMGSEDYDPSEVHAKTAEIRRLLDVADAMADQVLATRKADA